MYIREGAEGDIKLKPLYAELNRNYFGGALPNIKLAWSGRLKGAIGLATVRYTGGKADRSLMQKYLEEIPVHAAAEIKMDSLKITMSTTFDLQLDDIKAVMLHEMVHILLYTKKKLGRHHDTSEFVGYIKNLRLESGLNVPFKESDFRKSPKLQAKDGLVMIIYSTDGKIGATVWSDKFVKSKYLLFAKQLTYHVTHSPRVWRVECYKIKHPIIASQGPKRSLNSGLSWSWTDETTANEIKRQGKGFFLADKKTGGRLYLPGLGISEPDINVNVELKLDKNGDFENASEFFK